MGNIYINNGFVIGFKGVTHFQKTRVTMSNMGNGWIGDKSMREKAITNQILKYLKSIPECFAFKEHGSIYGVSGLPDIICCYKGKFVAFEVKTEKGRLSKLQEFMITKINGSGGMAFKVTSLQEVKDILKGVMPE